MNQESTSTLRPPTCFICKTDYEGNEDKLHYCICDTAVCTDCLKEVEHNDEIWVCPKCKNKNDVASSKLIRTT